MLLDRYHEGLFFNILPLTAITTLVVLWYRGVIQFDQVLPPGADLYFQFICQDLTVPDGLILSNAVRGRTPSETAFLPN